jgi:murein DD-endopeptidase MepM/ murein hydrolase activator NlpD
LVLDINTVASGLRDKVAKRLPEREFLHYKRDVGMQVYRLTTRAQVIGLTGLAALLTYTAVATSAMIGSSTIEASAENEVTAMRAELAALRQGVAKTTARVEQRQQFLAQLVSGKADPSQLAALMPALAAPAAAGASAVLKPLAELDRAQLALADHARTAAEARFEKSSALIRRLGLQPARFLKQSTFGMGGPEEKADSPLAGAEPQFKALFVSWQKLDLLEKGMSAIPSLKPVKAYTYTSGYGVRYDPFTGDTAMHKGVDLAGPVGEPIHAAADGVVVDARYHPGGYGKYVEIDHGAGIVTRYGHMSRIDVKKGDRIARGEQIGGMGSTGRSTGSHLHYEVLIDGRQVNPMPFLEAGDRVLAAQQSAGTIAVGGPVEPTGN